MRRDGLPVKDFADGRQFEAMTLALKQRHAQAIPDLPRYGRRRDIEPAGALAAVRIPSRRGIGDIRAAGFRSSSDLNDRAASGADTWPVRPERLNWGREQTGSFGQRTFKSRHSGWRGHRRKLTPANRLRRPASAQMQPPIHAVPKPEPRLGYARGSVGVQQIGEAQSTRFTGGGPQVPFVASAMGQ